jgi:signal peptidase I
MAFILFWSILGCFFIQRYVVSIGIVQDQSMLPLLPEGGYFLVNKAIYHLARPQRGDVVVFRLDPQAEEWYVKRVIGLEGDTLLIRSGQVSINGQVVQELYAVGGTFPDLGPLRLEPGRYFVLGDNRTVSEDSRHFGAVPLHRIEGRLAAAGVASGR